MRIIIQKNTKIIHKHHVRPQEFQVHMAPGRPRPQFNDRFHSPLVGFGAVCLGHESEIDEIAAEDAEQVW